MLTCTTTANRWPARCAYTAAAIFISASGTANVSYGWGKGSDFASCLVWAGVAGAVAILAAIAWPAFIKSVEARRWSAAAMTFVALILATTYSTVAALGSAAGARMQAAATETATTGTRQRAEADYAAARAELAKLSPARPAGEVEALLAAARPVCRVHVANGVRQTVCGKPAALEAELARARQREKLQAAADKAGGTLSSGPARVANSDARALARYLAAVGLDVSTDRLNDLLVLLAIVMVEAGTGLSLAVGMALSGSPTVAVAEPDTAQTAPAAAPAATVRARPVMSDPHAHEPYTARARPSDTASEAVVRWLHSNGGRTEGVRRLAEAVQQPPSTVSDRLRRLAADGRVRLAPGRRGTVIELAAGATLN